MNDESTSEASARSLPDRATRRPEPGDEDALRSASSTRPVAIMVVAAAIGAAVVGFLLSGGGNAEPGGATVSFVPTDGPGSAPGTPGNPYARTTPGPGGPPACPYLPDQVAL